MYLVRIHKVKVRREIMKISKSKSILGLACAGALGATLLVGAYAQTPKALGAESGTQTYTTTDAAGTGAWTNPNNGKIDISLTSDGSWIDPDNPDTTHPAGTYIVTIPTSETWSGVRVGGVNVNDDYTVNVKGALQDGKEVHLSATSGVDIKKGDTTITSLAEHTRQGSGTTGTEYTTSNYRTFTQAQAAANPDATTGALGGTNVTDNIQVTGSIPSAGTYTGSVQYTATLANTPTA